MSVGTKKPASKKSKQATVDAWNAKYSDGQLVDVWPFIREGFQPKRAVQWGEALILGGHTPGIYVRPGGFMALTHVDAVVAEAGDEST